MPNESGSPRQPRKRRLPAKPKEDGFVVFEVDGFAQLTPEQRTWPVVDFQKTIRQAEPPADAGEKPAGQ